MIGYGFSDAHREVSVGPPPGRRCQARQQAEPPPGPAGGPSDSKPEGLMTRDSDSDLRLAVARRRRACRTRGRAATDSRGP